MATIFGLIVFFGPIVLICTNLDRIANFIEAFINFNFPKD
jgi:hypothetical protein